MKGNLTDGETAAALGVLAFQPLVCAHGTIPAPRERDGIEAALERLAQITKKGT